MRPYRTGRRGFIDLGQIALGDYILIFAGLLAIISLFLPWFVSSVAKTSGEWAFSYSEWVAVIYIVFFLATLLLVFYPAVSRQSGWPELPFATPLVFMTMGVVLLLLATFELGKYDCIACQGVTRGIGVYLAWFASLLFIIGAVIKWGSRPRRTVA